MTEEVGGTVRAGKRDAVLRVRVRLYATLRMYGPQQEGPVSVELPAPATVGSALQALGIPEELPKVVLLNGRHASTAQPLREGDELALFPPVEGG